MPIPISGATPLDASVLVPQQDELTNLGIGGLFQGLNKGFQFGADIAMRKAVMENEAAYRNALLGERQDYHQELEDYRNQILELKRQAAQKGGVKGLAPAAINNAWRSYRQHEQNDINYDASHGTNFHAVNAALATSGIAPSNLAPIPKEQEEGGGNFFKNIFKPKEAAKETSATSL